MARKPTAPPPTTHRAALYVRVSTEDQANEGYGLGVQLDQVTAYARAFGLDVVQTYTDPGISGTTRASERPGLSQAIADAQAQQYDVLIVPAIDRLARKATVLLAIWDELER